MLPISIKLNPLDSESNLLQYLPDFEEGESTSSLIESTEKKFGSIVVYLHALGSYNYRIEWFSKMTGASTSLVRSSKGKYLVVRKWAAIKKMPDVSSLFTSRKQALIHFLSNVDVIKAADTTMNSAKQLCLELFAKQEGLKEIKPTRFPRIRMQGAIGRRIEVRAPNSTKDRVVAYGVLLQIIGNLAEVKITERIDLSNPSDFQKFPMKQIYLP